MDFLVDLRGKIPSVRADEEIEQDEVTVSKHPPVNKLVDQAAVAPSLWARQFRSVPRFRTSLTIQRSP